MNTTPTIDQLFETFDLDPKYGFINVEAIDRLPPYFSPWEYLIDKLPSLLLSHRFRPAILELPTLSIISILSDSLHCKRAYNILSTLSHLYLRGQDHQPGINKLPPCLAETWIEISSHLGVFPIATYAEPYSLISKKYPQMRSLVSLMDNV